MRDALAAEWAEAPVTDPTQAFLAKCHGWEDTQGPEEVVAEIYAARTISSRGATLFREESS